MTLLELRDNRRCHACGYRANLVRTDDTEVRCGACLEPVPNDDRKDRR